jgi:hypothetical protein
MKKIININNLFIISWIFIILSINHPVQIYNLKEFINIIRQVLSLAPLLVFIISLFIFFFLKEKNKDIFLIVFTIYFISQLVSFFFDSEINLKDSGLRIFWPILSLIVILFLYNVNILKNKILKIFFLILIFYIFSLTLLILIKVSVEFFEGYNISLYDITFLQSFSNYRDIPIPRSSGVGRNLIIIYLCLYVLFVSNIRIQLYLKFFVKFLIIIIVFFILHLQNRSSIYFLILFNILNFFYFMRHEELKIKFKKILILIIIPGILHISLISNRLIHNNTMIKKIDPSISSEGIEKKKNLLEQIKQSVRVLDVTNSSGRFILWKKSIIFISKNPYLGYGPQADRFLIQENVSNIVLYALICGGVISFFMILLTILISLFRIFFIVFKKKLFFKKKYYLEKICILILTFLLFRSLVEISFGVYGFDFLLFILCMFIIQNYLFIKNQKTR